MKNEEILNQEEQDQELPTITAAFSSIYNGNTKQVSYSDTHNSVYKLCKRGFAEQILNKLITISSGHFHSILQKINCEGSSSNIADFVEMIKKVNQSIERIGQVLLYIQSNYINDPKRQHNTVKDILNSAFFKSLCENKKVLYRVVDLIAQARIQGKQGQVVPLIQAINQLDQKQVFLPQYLYKNYLQKLSSHYEKLFGENYQKMNTKQFLQSTKKTFQQQREWLQKNFMRVKGKKLIEQLMQNLFDNSFSPSKQALYTKKPDQLFSTVTLQFLELLDQKNHQPELSSFTQWYINQIKQKLSLLDKSDNNSFLTDFLALYLSISKSLSSIKKYNIGYKVTFFFENWINQDKIQLPRRVNIYFENLIEKEKGKKKIGSKEGQGKGQAEQGGFNEKEFEKFVVLFRFIKEKDYFQKEFRRIYVLRIVYDEGDWNGEIENKMIEEIQRQCGADYAQKLRALKSATEDSNSIEKIANFKATVFEDTVWPFQSLKNKPIISPQLLSFSKDYKQKYEQKFKGRILQWHPIKGFSILTIKFSNHTQQFKMDTAMTNIMLALQSLNFKCALSQILAQTNFNLQDITDQLYILKNQKILEIASNPSSKLSPQSQISLSTTFVPSCPGKCLDLTTTYLSLSFSDTPQQQQLKSQRKMMVQSYIVKILKNNKSVSSAQLYQAITPMIEGRGFKFNKQFVDGAMKGLVDKRYVREIEEGVWGYLAS